MFFGWAAVFVYQFGGSIGGRYLFYPVGEVCLIIRGLHYQTAVLWGLLSELVEGEEPRERLAQRLKRSFLIQLVGESPFSEPIYQF